MKVTGQNCKLLVVVYIGKKWTRIGGDVQGNDLRWRKVRERIERGSVNCSSQSAEWSAQSVSG